MNGVYHLYHYSFYVSRSDYKNICENSCSGSSTPAIYIMCGPSFGLCLYDDAILLPTRNEVLKALDRYGIGLLQRRWFLPSHP
jgi:hypothetical protein